VVERKRGKRSDVDDTRGEKKGRGKVMVNSVGLSKETFHQGFREEGERKTEGG